MMTYRKTVSIALAILLANWTNVNGAASADVMDEIVAREIDPDHLDADETNDGGHPRSLQLFASCSTYQYTSQIRDDLRMSYVVNEDRLRVLLVYDGEAWIGLGTNPIYPGKLLGAEAWIGLPENSEPEIYYVDNYLTAFITPKVTQTLENGLVAQAFGKTTVQFDKLLNEDKNVDINGNGDVVFIWAIGRGNKFGSYRHFGAFLLNLKPCTDPTSQPEEVDVKIVCGLFSLSLFCPLSGCGFFGRMMGLC
jgi:hypothetical protein